MKFKYQQLLGIPFLSTGIALLCMLSNQVIAVTKPSTSISNRTTQIPQKMLLDLSKTPVSLPFTGTGVLAKQNTRIGLSEYFPDPMGFSATESVIGPDGRKKIANTTSYPNRAIAFLTVKFPSYTASCTGWFIGPRTVATAGHCVYDVSTRKWATTVTVYPGRNGSYSPFGYTTSKRLFSMTGWTRDHNSNFDLGAIQTNNTLGNSVGWFGYSWQQSNSYPGNFQISGYPGDKANATLWGMGGNITHANAYHLWHQIDTYGGESGAPLYHLEKGTCCYVVGAHTYGVSLPPYYGNSATRLGKDFYNNLNAWKLAVYP
ncbi:MAG: trypsin-like serine protease [Methyloglobulus sp.]|nr:trypsin-like serine protease [Methyloglobulus sp.]